MAHILIGLIASSLSMRLALPILLLFADLPLAEAAAFDARWCAINNEGYANCSFNDQDTCRASISGVGGTCTPQSPIGHRQPRATPGDHPAPEDRKLDRLIQQFNKTKTPICRGC